MIKQNDYRVTRSYLSIIRDEKIHQTQWVHKQLNLGVNVNYSLEKGFTIKAKSSTSQN